MQHIKLPRFLQNAMFLPAGCILLILSSCASKTEEKTITLTEVPVITIDTLSVPTYKNFSGNLEGINNVEIRPQVEGYLQKIYIDEGSYVKKGQPLFLIDEKPYTEQINNAVAAVATAAANLKTAGIEVDRFEKLVDGKVISPVQLDRARAAFDAAQASKIQAEAVRRSAQINKDFALIKAPFDGYIGRLPYRAGSFVSRNESEALTVLSDTHKMYAYFSMSENEFLLFKQRYKGNTLEEKIKNIPPVTLALPDNSIYPDKGKVEIVQGQFDKNTAAITFRASFPNSNGLLRSGNTGTVTLLQNNYHVIRIPQAATFEIQNKVLAYVIGKDNKIHNVSLKVGDKDDNYYIITQGLAPGDRIAAKGLDRLHEDMLIKPVNL